LLIVGHLVAVFESFGKAGVVAFVVCLVESFGVSPVPRQRSGNRCGRAYAGASAPPPTHFAAAALADATRTGAFAANAEASALGCASSAGSALSDAP
jgi:hypothetical protein